MDFIDTCENTSKGNTIGVGTTRVRPPDQSPTTWQDGPSENAPIATAKDPSTDQTP